MMTPEEFYLKMCSILTLDGDDTERSHIYMDELMCNLLIELGYKKGVDVFIRAEKWYS